MVVKSEDLEILENAYREALNNKGSIFLLQCEYGIEVDDLLEYLQSNKKNDNTIFIKSECIGYKNTEPYSCFLELLDAIQNKVLYLDLNLKIEKLNAENYDPIFDPIISERFIEIFSTILYSYNTVFYFKNIQSGDTNSLNLFSYLADFAKNKNILIVASYSLIEGVNPYFNNVLNLLKLKSNVKIRKIENFNLAEFFLFLKESGYNIPDYIIEKIYSITKGNKLNTLGLLNNLERNNFIDDEKNWIGYDMDFNEDLLQDPDPVMVNVYHSIDDKHLIVLNNASVIGNNFTLPLLKEITNIEEAYLKNILKDLSDKNIINFQDQQYFFVSSSFRYYVYSKISSIRKKILHRKIAEILELEHDSPETIANHFFNANIKEKALNYYLEAGFKSIKNYDFKRAYEYLKKVEQMGIIHKVDIIFALAETCKNLDRYIESIKYYTSVLEELDHQRKILAYAGLGTVYTRLGDTENALKYLNQILKYNLETCLMISVHRDLADVYFLKKDMKTSHEHIDIAIELLKNCNDHFETAETYKDLGKIYSEENEDLEKIEKIYLEAIEEYFKVNYYNGIARVYNNIADLYLEKKSLSNSLKYFETALKYADKAGNYVLILAINYNISKVYFYWGNISKYLFYINISEKLIDIESMGEFSFLIRFSLGNFSIIKGNFNDAKKYFIYCRDLAFKLDITYLWIIANLKLLYIELVLGRAVDSGILEQNWQNLKKYITKKSVLSELESKATYYMLYNIKEDFIEFNAYINAADFNDNSITLLEIYILYDEFLIFNYKVQEFVALFEKINKLSNQKEYKSMELQMLAVVYYYVNKDPRFSEYLEQLENYFNSNSLILLLSKLYLYLGICQYNRENYDMYLNKAELLFSSIGANGYINLIKKIKK